MNVLLLDNYFGNAAGRHRFGAALKKSTVDNINEHQDNPDLIWCQTHHKWRDALINKQEHHCPIVMAWHTYSQDDHINDYMPYLPYIDHHIVFSQDARRALTQHLGLNATVIPLLIDNPFSTTDQGLIAGLDNYCCLGYVGRFSQLKNIPLLFKIIEQLNDHYKLILVGRERSLPYWIKQSLKDAQTNGYRHRIRIYNWTTDPILLGRYYKAFKYLLFPSYKDTFGNVVVEAAYCGTPTLTLENAISEYLPKSWVCQSFQDWLEKIKGESAVELDFSFADDYRLSLRNFEAYHGLFETFVGLRAG